MRVKFSGPFLYFLSGIIASTGINIITSVITSQVRNFDSFFNAIIGIVVVVLSYGVAEIAAVQEDHDRLLGSSLRDTFTDEEKNEVTRELEERKTSKLSIYKNAMLIPMTAIIIALLLREAVLIGQR